MNNRLLLHHGAMGSKSPFSLVEVMIDKTYPQRYPQKLWATFFYSLKQRFIDQCIGDLLIISAKILVLSHEWFFRI